MSIGTGHMDESQPTVSLVEAEEERVADDEVATAVDEPQVMDREGNLLLDEEDKNDDARAIMISAGLLGGILGCVLCGPMAGCLVGTGTAIGTHRPTPAGNVARSMGQCALSCAHCSQTKAAAWDEKHAWSAQVQQTELYQKGRVWSEAPLQMATWSWESIRLADETYSVSRRSWKGIERTLDALHVAVIGTKPGETTTNHNNKPHSIGRTETDDENLSGSDFSIDEDDDNGDYDENAVGEEMSEGRHSPNGYAAVQVADQSM